MDRFFESLPNSLKALGIMIAALVVIIIMNPPVTVCDAQMQIFRESQKNFLYPPPAEGGVRIPAQVKTLMDNCVNDNSPGGCFDLFVGLKKMVVDLRNIPEQCAEKAGEEPEIKAWLWRSLKLMVQIAWGDRAPASYMQKNGWFDTSEVTLFCNLKRHAVRLYGKDRFAQWQEEMLRNMPKAEGLTREQIWPRSILSTPCDAYR